MKRFTNSYKKFKEHVRQILILDGSPHRASLAFAIGVFIAFAPHLGLHTVSAVGISWLFRLNLPIIMVGVFVNNPWTMFPMYGFSLCLGNYLLGNGFNCLPSGLSYEGMIEFVKDSPLPFILGTLISGFTASILSYFIVKRTLFLMHFKGKEDTIASI